MAKVKFDYLGFRMKAEGDNETLRTLSEKFLSAVKDKGVSDKLIPKLFVDGYRDPENGDETCEDVKPLTASEQVAPGAQWDVVAIYDDAGIPSIMHRFRRVSNKELFGGSDKPHPAFVIENEVYDEIYISVYPNVMIHGKPYSLPYQEPATGFTAGEFAEACFSKGEGWHPLTAAEWGLLANLSYKNGTLPHGNTKNGKWHGDEKESGEITESSYRTMTGSGPETWTHDHTKTGVHDLCGNVYETIRGLRIKNGVLMVAKNNDAALPETDLTQCGDDWQLMTDDKGAPIYVDANDGITFTTDPDMAGGCNGCEWSEVKTECKSEMLKEYAMFAGEPDAFCFVDATEGEYLPIRGGSWDNGDVAGVFNLNLRGPRSDSFWSLGGRSAYFKKKS